MVNLTEISKPSGGVSPIAPKHASSAVESISPAEKIDAIDPLKSPIDNQKKAKKQPKNLEKKASKKSTEVDNPVTTYDNKGKKHQGGQIDYSV